ncbi:MAG: hypothetical protein ACRD30_04575 [Bryobacteraceae bacterium]
MALQVPVLELPTAFRRKVCPPVNPINPKPAGTNAAGQTGQLWPDAGPVA